jgi:nucleoside-diphosphate-sugar epimerase
MRVFITGGTGFIGSAVVDELIGAGHQVIGLARSDAGERQLTAAGAGVHRGSLEDLDGLKRAAAESEGVIHLAFIHDFTNFTDFAASCVKDQAAIETLGGALAGSNRPLVISSGVLGLAQGRPGTEEDVPSDAFPRKSEQAGLSFASKGVRASVIRLSPSVHGDGDHGFVPQLIKGARANGFASYVGDGKNRWPAVHRLDAARLYRLALEKGTAGGRYHGVADEGVPIRDIAEIIAKRSNVPAVSKSAEEVVGALGFIGHVLAMDGPSSSKLTQERLGWRPTHPGLIADLERGTYFDAT